MPTHLFFYVFISPIFFHSSPSSILYIHTIPILTPPKPCAKNAVKKTSKSPTKTASNSKRNNATAHSEPYLYDHPRTNPLPNHSSNHHKTPMTINTNQKCTPSITKPKPWLLMVGKSRLSFLPLPTQIRTAIFDGKNHLR